MEDTVVQTSPSKSDLISPQKDLVSVVVSLPGSFNMLSGLRTTGFDKLCNETCLHLKVSYLCKFRSSSLSFVDCFFKLGLYMFKMYIPLNIKLAITTNTLMKYCSYDTVILNE